MYYGLDSTGVVSAVYDNKEAADKHVARWDEMILSGRFVDPEKHVLTVVPQVVLSEPLPFLPL